MSALDELTRAYRERDRAALPAYEPDPDQQMANEKTRRNGGRHLTSTRVKRKLQRRQRRRKLASLRSKLADTRSPGERQQLIAKIRRISARAPIPDR